MGKIMGRVVVAILAWAGLDSWLDGSGKKLAVLDTRDHSIRVIHHRWFFYEMAFRLKRMVTGGSRGFDFEDEDDEHEPYVEPIPDEEDMKERLVMDMGPSPGATTFDEWTQGVVALTSDLSQSVRLSPNDDQVLAHNRDILASAGVDLLDPATKNGLMAVLYSIAAEAHRTDSFEAIILAESMATHIEFLSQEIEQGQLPPGIDNPWGDS